MLLSFLKMQGAGNDFMVVDERHSGLPPLSTEHIRQLADRRKGIGFDQLLWISEPRHEGSEAYYQIFNADGSEVEQCGNGARCVAWVIAHDGASDAAFRLDCPAGRVDAQILDDNLIAVSMGLPQFAPGAVPFAADTEACQYTLEVGTETLDVAVLSMGNPHCVLQVQSVADAPVTRLGPLIEKHARFPAHTNVGFMTIRDRQHIDLRVHERGAGETLACGTGACAAMVAGRRLNLLDTEVTVQLPGGQLVVSWANEKSPVWLTGEAQLTYEGTVEL